MTTEMNPIELEPKAAIDHLDVIEKTPSAIKMSIMDHLTLPRRRKEVVRRKMDIYILPVLCFMNICAFLDKANIGNANTAGMSADLGITKKQYKWPEMLLLKFIPPKFFLTGIVTFWSLASTLQGVTSSYGGMLACAMGRQSLSISPCCTLEKNSVFVGPSSKPSLVLQTPSQAAAYGLVQAKTSITPWKLVFIVKSTPTFLAAALIFLLLPSGPDRWAWLSPRENEIARERVERSQSKEHHGGYSVAGFKAALKEPWTWWIAIIHYAGGSAFNSLSVFLTAIIKELGYTSVNAQGLSAPPYLVAYVIAVITAYWSDRLAIRGWFIGIANLVGGVGYMMIAYVGPRSVRYFAAYVTVVGVYVGQPLMFSWCATNADTSSKRASSLVIFLITGQLGSITGSNMYVVPYDDAPRYHKGNSICAGLLFLSSILCFTGT
nr:uncharacterized protein I203_05955 [Kwoniella mangroviensis CBS 8507]OCF64711.1 hypothetical protein I203_05955 [Kwoniella mangroviensis CBS 8507]